nr:hypothetical protein P5627_19095 [Bacillus safensis]
MKIHMEISHPQNPSIHVGQIEYSHIEVGTSPQMLKIPLTPVSRIFIF